MNEYLRLIQLRTHFMYKKLAASSRAHAYVCVCDIIVFGTLFSAINTFSPRQNALCRWGNKAPESLNDLLRSKEETDKRCELSSVHLFTLLVLDHWASLFITVWLPYRASSHCLYNTDWVLLHVKVGSRKRFGELGLSFHFAFTLI